MNDRCAICGAHVKYAEAIASRYACFTTCIPIVKSEHLVTFHTDYLRESKRVGRVVVYSSITLALLSLLIYPIRIELAFVTAILGLLFLTVGTFERLRILKKYKLLYEGGGLKNNKKSDARSNA